MLDRAREIADDVLFPATLDVDRADRVPASHLDLLAAEGFYGVAARDDLDFPTMTAIVRALAGGCMTTTFVWIQHHGPVLALSATPGELADRFLPALAAGERRAGIGLAGARATTPLRVRRDAGGFRLDGTIPWVTGWDMIDTLYVAARDEQEVVCYLLMDAVAGPTLAIEFPGLVAVGASRTANVTLTGHHVPADRLVHTVPYVQWSAGDALGSALNGFLSLGLVDRCCRLLAAGPDTAVAVARRLAAAAEACRTALLAADPDALVDGLPASAWARADASALAWRAAGAVTAAGGARSVLLDQHAQRLGREAIFLLVFGSRPAMRDALLGRLATDG